MKFLADECVDRLAIDAIRDAGHDVDLVSDRAPQAADRDVVALASVEGRVLVTEDRDFGQLIFAMSHESTGVLYIRWPSGARGSLYESVKMALDVIGPDLAHAFAVLTPGRVRIRRSRPPD